VVINFPTIDALCHAWDLSASLGRPLEFPAEWIPAIRAVVEVTCTDAVRALGLIKDVAPIATDASDTERLMAHAGRSGAPTAERFDAMLDGAARAGDGGCAGEGRTTAWRRSPCATTRS